MHHKKGHCLRCILVYLCLITLGSAFILFDVNSSSRIKRHFLVLVIFHVFSLMVCYAVEYFLSKVLFITLETGKYVETNEKNK